MFFLGGQFLCVDEKSTRSKKISFDRLKTRINIQKSIFSFLIVFCVLFVCVSFFLLSFWGGRFFEKV